MHASVAVFSAAPSPPDVRPMTARQIELPPPETIVRDVSRALEEDIGSGDVTADLLPAGAAARARVVTREAAVLCGTAWFDACFQELDAGVEIEWLSRDGDHVHAGALLCRIEGPARALVTAERTALNFLQTLSGTATATSQFVDAIRGTRTTILDTRKTLPGLRLAQKYAVRVGGGANHRMGLHDAVLIKENHIATAGSIAAAIARARTLHPGLLVETEVENFGELREALAAGADRDHARRVRTARAVAGGRRSRRARAARSVGFGRHGSRAGDRGDGCGFCVDRRAHEACAGG